MIEITMSLYRIQEKLHENPTKLKKIMSLEPRWRLEPADLEPVQRSSGRSSNTNIPLQNTFYPALYIPRIITSSGQMGDVNVPSWHHVMEHAFESFLIRLDDIFLSLKKEQGPDITGYREVCEKLRTEVLIALDKLEMFSMPLEDVLLDGKHSEFFKKMNNFKTQLSALRWQYHSAITDLGQDFTNPGIGNFKKSTYPF